MMESKDEEDLEIRYEKTKESLEQSWEEIELLEAIVSEQQAEIADLRQQIAQSRQIDLYVPTQLDSMTKQDSKFLACRPSVTNSQTLGAQNAQFNLLKIPIFSVLAQKAMQVEVENLQIEKRVSTESVAKPAEQGGETRCRNVKLKEIEVPKLLLIERDNRIAELEMKLEQLKQSSNSKMETMMKEMKRLDTERKYREEQMIGLQSQLAQYMLKEVYNKSLHAKAKQRISLHF